MLDAFGSGSHYIHFDSRTNRADQELHGRAYSREICLNGTTRDADRENHSGGQVPFISNAVFFRSFLGVPLFIRFFLTVLSQTLNPKAIHRGLDCNESSTARSVVTHNTPVTSKI